MAYTLAMLLVGLCPGKACGQTYQDGYKKYTMGDMIGAQKALLPALRNPAVNNAEKSQIYKLLGIVQFQLNKKDQATASFKSAVALNPKLVIRPDEVLDGSVIEFYNKIKSSYHPAPPPKTTADSGETGAVQGGDPGSHGGADSNKPSPKESQKDAAKDSPKVTTKQQQISEKPAKGKGAKNTRLQVNSNAPGAAILIDDILVGNAGKDLEVKAGTVTLTLKANGYKAKSFRLPIKAGVLNQVTLNLEKLGKKPPKTVAAAEGGALGMKKGAVAKEKTAPGKKKGDLFADELDAPPSPTLAKVPGPGEAPPPTLVPSGAPTAVAAGQPVPGAAAMPMTTAPNGTMTMTVPAAGGAGTGGTSVVVVPINPGGGYGQPMMPAYPYGAYGSPYPSPAYGGYGYGDPMMGAQSPIAPAPPPPPDYYGKGKGRKSVRGKPVKAKPPMALLALPFGTPQFANGSIVLGVIFGSIQGGGLYWWYTNDQQASSAYNTAKGVRNDPGYTTDQDKTNRDQYLSKMNDYVKAKENQASMGLYGTLGFWAISVAEGFISYNSPPGPSRAASLMPAADGAFAQDEDRSSTEDSTEESAVPPLRPTSSLRLDLGPVPASDNSKGPGLALIMDYRF